MNKKLILSIILTLIVISIFLINGCKKDHLPGQHAPDTYIISDEAAVDNAEAEVLVNDIVNLVVSAQSSVANQTNGIYHPFQLGKMKKVQVTNSHNQTFFYVLTIDLGTSNSSFQNQRPVRGTINVSYPGDFNINNYPTSHISYVVSNRDTIIGKDTIVKKDTIKVLPAYPLLYDTITFTNFYINDRNIQGRILDSTDSKYKWANYVEAQNIQVTRTNGSYHFWNSFKYRINSGDTTTLFGNAEGTDINGNPYNASTNYLSPLIKYSSCLYIKSGITNFSSDVSPPQYYIDYSRPDTTTACANPKHAKITIVDNINKTKTTYIITMTF